MSEPKWNLPPEAKRARRRGRGNGQTGDGSVIDAPHSAGSEEDTGGEEKVEGNGIPMSGNSSTGETADTGGFFPPPMPLGDPQMPPYPGAEGQFPGPAPPWGTPHYPHFGMHPQFPPQPPYPPFQPPHFPNPYAYGGEAVGDTTGHDGGPGVPPLVPPHASAGPPQSAVASLKDDPGSVSFGSGFSDGDETPLGQGVLEQAQPPMSASLPSGEADTKVPAEAEDDGAPPSKRAASERGPTAPRRSSTPIATMTERRKSPLDVNDRRTRKNAQSRMRAAKLREKIDEVLTKPEDQKSEEEIRLLDTYEDRRRRKNERSRERAIEKKAEIARILAIPEDKRTPEEKETLEVAMKAKQKKNEGDRMRRERIKVMNLKARGASAAASKGRARKLDTDASVVSQESASLAMADGRASSSTSAQGSIAVDRPPQGVAPVPPYGSVPGVGEVPLSPVPTALGHPSLSSPGTFSSPGLMSSIAFPSPPPTRPHMATAGSVGAVQQASQPAHLPMMPPAYQPPPPPSTSQLHLPQTSSLVQQQRHPDGSISISIGSNQGNGDNTDGGSTGRPGNGVGDIVADNSSGFSSSQTSLPAAPPSPEIMGGPNLSDMSHLLFCGNSDQGDDNDGAEEDEKPSGKAV